MSLASQLFLSLSQVFIINFSLVLWYSFLYYLCFFACKVTGWLGTFIAAGGWFLGGGLTFLWSSIECFCSVFL